MAHPRPKAQRESDKAAVFIELTSPELRLPQTCERTARHYEGGRTVALFVPDPALAEELDRLLWVFQQQSFIPHVRLEHAEPPVIEPVLIFSNPDAAAEGEAPPLEFDALILVGAAELPPWFSRFCHICDFAEVYNEQLKEASRRRYGACQSAGYRMHFVRAGYR